MTGKAEKRGDIVDSLKAMQHQNQQNYGLSRAQDVGAPKQRSYSIGTADNDPEYVQKLDIRGGVMLGSLAYAGVATSELAVSGIIDTSDYNSPRIYITNTALNTLKVLVPTITDGQEIWVRANAGVAFTIQNTAGTGDETTGNIECMAGTDYTMTGDDWICFHYDNTDLKFHQVTAGKNNIGGGSSGEVFTWTAAHSANSFDLDTLNAVNFAAGGSITGSAGSIIYDAVTTFNHTFTVNLLTKVTIASTGITSVVPLAFIGAGISGATSLVMDGDINCANNDIANVDNLYFGAIGSSNRIGQDPSGNMEYAVISSADDHEFFVGGIAQMTLENTGAKFWNGIDINTQAVTNSGQITFASTGLITGSDVGFSSLSGSLYCNVTSTDSFFVRTNGQSRFRVHDEGIEILNVDTTKAWLSIDESTTPPTATDVAGDECKLFCVDNGSGKTILKVQFNTGTPITIATEV